MSYVNELMENMIMYVEQLDFVIKQIEQDKVNKYGLLIQLEGIKAQMEMDLD